jgi:hypothetical protein
MKSHKNLLYFSKASSNKIKSKETFHKKSAMTHFFAFSFEYFIREAEEK